MVPGSSAASAVASSEVTAPNSRYARSRWARFLSGAVEAAGGEDLVDRLVQPDLVGEPLRATQEVLGDPRVAQQYLSTLFEQEGEPSLPGQVGRRQADFAQDGVADQVEEMALVPDVVVDVHGRTAQFRGQLSHAQIGEAAPAGEAEARLDHVVTGQLAVAPRARPRRTRGPVRFPPARPSPGPPRRAR